MSVIPSSSLVSLVAARALRARGDVRRDLRCGVAGEWGGVWGVPPPAGEGVWGMGSVSGRSSIGASADYGKRLML